PSVPPEVTALTAELQSLRTELQEGPADEPVASQPAAAVDLEPVHDAIAELTFEVRALRKRLRLRAE
ncbi:MAG: hypothetical protein M3394_07930, partial [Actinomycetota bacterium]|nr:hypothetical protein [Actinomycetota bacterium]